MPITHVHRAANGESLFNKKLLLLLLIYIAYDDYQDCHNRM